MKNIMHEMTHVNPVGKISISTLKYGKVTRSTSQLILRKRLKLDRRMIDIFKGKRNSLNAPFPPPPPPQKKKPSFFPLPKFYSPSFSLTGTRRYRNRQVISGFPKTLSLNNRNTNNLLTPSHSTTSLLSFQVSLNLLIKSTQGAKTCYTDDKKNRQEGKRKLY